MRCAEVSEWNRDKVKFGGKELELYLPSKKSFLNRKGSGKGVTEEMCKVKGGNGKKKERSPGRRCGWQKGEVDWRDGDVKKERNDDDANKDANEM